MGWSPTLPVLLHFFDGNLGTWGEGREDGAWVSVRRSSGCASGDHEVGVYP